MPYEPYLLIPLRRRDGTLRAHAIIDAADAHLTKYRWCLHNMGYAVRNVCVDGTTSVVLLHRSVLGLTPGDGLQADHKNRDKLDCRRSNLRVGTHALNAQNVSGHTNRSSKYRGVSWDTQRKSWVSSVRLDGREHHLGRYETELEAADVASAWRRKHMPFAVEDQPVVANGRTRMARA